jgi:hypothetical protein
VPEVGQPTHNARIDLANLWQTAIGALGPATVRVLDPA